MLSYVQLDPGGSSPEVLANLDNAPIIQIKPGVEGGLFGSKRRHVGVHNVRFLAAFRAGAKPNN